eukprot:TRINITY_DN5740_c0_g1_i1.p3 TRINITY_DN5740_c0_g1~~TRINITY_DN5740_c0_g1_i1.p3  ORF type:complete len:129 (-),score=2.22 TRINITY_DN5740_c0_g1_i1:222-608(-)
MYITVQSCSLVSQTRRPVIDKTSCVARSQIYQVRKAVVNKARKSVNPQAFLGGLFGGGPSGPEGAYYICAQCGYIYDGREDFQSLDNSYKCPKCTATKRKFRVYKGEVKGRPRNDLKSMKQRMSERQW